MKTRGRIITVRSSSLWALFAAAVACGDPRATPPVELGTEPLPDASLSEVMPSVDMWPVEERPVDAAVQGDAMDPGAPAYVGRWSGQSMRLEGSCGAAAPQDREVPWQGIAELGAVPSLPNLCNLVLSPVSADRAELPAPATCRGTDVLEAHITAEAERLTVSLLLEQDTCTVRYTYRYRKKSPHLFSALPVHPAASVHPHESSRTLSSLHVFEEQVYTAHGVAAGGGAKNTIMSWDPIKQRYLSHLTLDQGAALLYRTALGRVFALVAGAGGGTDYAAGPPWRPQGGLESVHTFDLAAWKGTLFVAGMQGKDAVIWKSSDEGKAWTIALREPPLQSNDKATYFFIAPFNDKLYIQAADLQGGIHPKAKVFDGQAWTDAPSLVPGTSLRGWKPIVFAGKVLLQGAPGGHSLSTFDGTSAERVDNFRIRDYAAQADRIYVLLDNETIVSSSDLRTWRDEGFAPDGSASMALFQGKLFMGAAEGRLYERAL